MSKPSLEYRGEGFSQLMQSLATAFVATFPAGVSFVIGGVTYTGAQIAAVFLQMKALFDAADDAHQLLKKTVADRDAGAPQARALVAGTVAMLEAMYGTDSVSFAKFGVPAKKTRQPLSVKEKLAAQTLAQATRTLRGTKGSRQTEAIQAEGTAVVSATVIDPASAKSAS